MSEDKTKDFFGDGWEDVEEQQAKNEEKAKLRGIGNLNLRKDETAQIIFLTGRPITVNEHFIKGMKYNPICTMQATGRCQFCGPKQKPSYKGYFLVLHRAYAYKERQVVKNADGDEEIHWVPKKDESNKAIIEPRLMVFGRGITDLNAIKAQGMEVNGKVDGVLNQEFKIVKIGQDTSSAINFFHKGKPKLTEKEKELINGRGEAELKELVKAFLLNPRDFASSTAVAADGDDGVPKGDEVDWDDK